MHVFWSYLPNMELAHLLEPKNSYLYELNKNPIWVENLGL